MTDPFALGPPRPPLYTRGPLDGTLKIQPDAEGKDAETMTENSECEPHHQLMKYDGYHCVVLTWGPVGSIEGGDRSWRFITQKGEAINVRPVQLPSNASPLCVPAQIESSLRVVRHLVNVVNGSTSFSIFDPNPPNPKDYARMTAKGLFEINLFIWMHTDKFPVLIPSSKGGYTETKRAELAKLLTDPNDPGTKILMEIMIFIMETCKPIKYPVDEGPVSVQDRELRMVLQFIEEQVGKEIMLSVLQSGVEIAFFDRPALIEEIEIRNLSKNPGKMFSGRFAQWVQETMKTRGISESEAEQFLAKHVTFLAKCEGRRNMHIYPIEDITVDVLDIKELDSFKITRADFERSAARLENYCLGTAEKESPTTGIETSTTPIASAQPPTSPVAEQKGDTGDLGRFAQSQQMLSSGILITKGELVEKMDPADIMLFNLLVTSNSKRKGWALSYREIAERMGEKLSHMQISRRRMEIEEKYGSEITWYIAKARQNQTRGGKINPDRCYSGPGRAINTNPPPENPSESD